MHIDHRQMLLNTQSDLCSVVVAQPDAGSDRLGRFLGGVIVLGLVVIGFALPFV